MSSQRAAISIGDRPKFVRKNAARPAFNIAATENALVRLLVLDDNPRTPHQIENSLWMWPHRISTARTARNAVKMCRHLAPAAIIVSLEFRASGKFSVIKVLRDEMPKAVIIAVGTAADAESPGPILDLGASAVITRDELQRPTLHELLMQLQVQPEDENAQAIVMGSSMTLPWRDSQIVGSLICDIKGTVTSANECLARWLDYPGASALISKCVWRDILNCSSDWMPWKAVAGDMTALLHRSVSVKASNEQLLWMNVEVFAAPNTPTSIQVIFVDQSELAQLTGRSASL